MFGNKATKSSKKADKAEGNGRCLSIHKNPNTFIIYCEYAFDKISITQRRSRYRATRAFLDRGRDVSGMHDGGY